VRIEDLDQPRVVKGADGLILKSLEALGFEWDAAPLYQSRRFERYEEVLAALNAEGRLFPCACSRKEILASAPHFGEEGPVYPGTCRQGISSGGRPRSLRLRVPDELIVFTDGVFGCIEQHLPTTVGDFVLRRADGLFAYQLAVVVDDADSGVNQVVRGADLLPSTPRQIYLYACLGWPVPRYIHLPLALGHDGEKISKRHGVLTLAPGDDGGELIWQALRFLGQDVPDALKGYPEAEVLRWGTEYFCLDRVSQTSRVPETLEA